MPTEFNIAEHVILFTDLHEYSIVTKALGTQRSLEFLQAFYERSGDLIVAHHGRIIKYIGDALLCVFPAQTEAEAIECAKQLRHAYAVLIAEYGITHDTELEIGISAGKVGIGVVGHASLRQLDVFGDEVNQAAVIGHHRGIAITESVYEKIKTRYATTRLPDRPVKWQTEPLKLWEIVG